MKEQNYKSIFWYIFFPFFSVIIGKIKKVCGCSRTDVTEVELILSSVGFSGFVVSCGALLYHTKVNLIIRGWAKKKCTKVFKSGGHILGHSASRR